MENSSSTATTTGVAIFGKGKMGTAIAAILGRGGSTVRHVSADEEATLTEDVVGLAVPYAALSGIVDRYRDQLAGKIVVDITNPVDFTTLDSLEVSPGGSAAAELQSALPDAKVVKAFNTNFAGTLDSGQVGTNRTTLLVAGDDADAKQALIDLATAGGVDAIDAGPLARARELEAIGFLQITLADAKKVGWSAGFAVIP